MLIKRVSIAAITLGLLLLTTATALACACCAEHGEYSVWTGSPDTYRLGLIKEMRFGTSADLYMTEAGFETIRGLKALESDLMTEGSDSFDLVGSFMNNAWRFEMKAPGGRSGTLALPRPSKMTVFKVDTHEVEVGAGEARLYKEFRFSGTVGNGSGFFGSSIVRPTVYSLIFQGRGNQCDNAEDFTHWRLEVSGPKAKYAFFGKMKN